MTSSKSRLIPINENFAYPKSIAQIYFTQRKAADVPAKDYSHAVPKQMNDLDIHNDDYRLTRKRVNIRPLPFTGTFITRRGKTPAQTYKAWSERTMVREVEYGNVGTMHANKYVAESFVEPGPGENVIYNGRVVVANDTPSTDNFRWLTKSKFL